MEKQDNKTYEVEYEKWGKIVIKAQLIIASIVCAIEVLNNVLLFCTKSQGYGPDTIVEKLIRYLLITSLFNFGMVIFSKITESRVTDEKAKRFFLMLFTTLMCADVAFSHYQFAVTFAIFVIPIVISILYEDSKLSIFTLTISFFGEIVAVVARAMDEEYNINGSYMAIEGITSMDGRVLGKMAHSERRGDKVAINIYGEQDLKIFESGVNYFR